jgi:Sugar-transfer associated ATP-grasp
MIAAAKRGALKAKELIWNAIPAGIRIRRRYWRKLYNIRRENPELKKAGYLPDWGRAYAVANGISSPDYISEIDFHSVIEPSLNISWRVDRYRDKNFHDQLRLRSLPQTLGRIMACRLVSAEYRPIETIELPTHLHEVVIKPAVLSGGGSYVRFVQKNDLSTVIAELLDASPESKRSDFIIQASIDQHPDLARIHPSSVNTVRQMTLRWGGEIVLISAVLRIGRWGSRVDNHGAGGLAVGISEGKLKTFGFDKNFHRFDVHPDSGFRFEGFAVPSMAEVEVLCIEMHERIPDLDLISWDVSVDKLGQPVLIEFNAMEQGINSYQLCNGPLFGERTTELLSGVF